MLSRPKTGEDQGDCYGFHLIYSGNHCETAEVSSFGKLRLLTGINPREFSWKLEPGAQFQAPEAFMTYAPDGWGGMSGGCMRLSGSISCADIGKTGRARYF